MCAFHSQKCLDLRLWLVLTIYSTDCGGPLRSYWKQRVRTPAAFTCFWTNVANAIRHKRFRNVFWLVGVLCSFFNSIALSLSTCHVIGCSWRQTCPNSHTALWTNRTRKHESLLFSRNFLCLTYLDRFDAIPFDFSVLLYILHIIKIVSVMVAVLALIVEVIISLFVFIFPGITHSY